MRHIDIETQLPWLQVGYDPYKGFSWEDYDGTWVKWGEGVPTGGPDEVFHLPSGVKCEPLGDALMLETVVKHKQATMLKDERGHVYGFRKNI